MTAPRYSDAMTGVTWASGEFQVVETTTDQLQHALVTAVRGRYELVSVTHAGGHDWVIITRRKPL